MMQKVVSVLSICVVMVVIGLVAVWTQEPFLVPSLASAAFTQILSPTQPNASPYSVGVGQVIGAIGGFIGVYVAASAAQPLFMSGHPLVYARVLAVFIAILVAVSLQLAAKATSPAGGATALVLSLGLETPTWAGAGRLLVGIVLVTILGEIGRRLVLAQQAKTSTGR